MRNFVPLRLTAFFDGQRKADRKQEWRLSLHYPTRLTRVGASQLLLGVVLYFCREALE